MIQPLETITVSAPIEAAFDYVAGFENIEIRDPGVVRAGKTSASPARIGTSFDLVTV